MKIVAALAGLAFLLGASGVAKADGDPFVYTIRGSFIDGEPDPSYNVGANGKAIVQIGASVVFTVYNSDTVVRTSRPMYALSGGLAPATGGAYLITINASGNDTVDMAPGDTMTYSLNNSNTSPSIVTGQHEASCTFNISDAKTPDSRGANATPVNVTVQ
jgi:hypothetical protein